MLSWLAFALLMGCVAVALWPRRFHRNHPKAGRKYCYPVFALLAGSLAMFVLLVHWHDVFVWAAVIFWMLWLSGLVFAIIGKKSDGFWPAFGMNALAWLLILLPIGSTVFHGGPDTPEAQAVTVTTANGETRQLAYVANVNASAPVSGEEVNTAETPPSLDDGKGPVHSWTELVQRVNGLPEAKKDAYIAAINQRSQFLGTWEDVQKYAEMEKKDKNLDTRVILVLNSNVSDKEARDAVRSDVGDATDTLPIVRTSGALVNTRGVDAGKIEDFADGRSQIRVILTTPVVKKDGTTTANTEAAKTGTGVLTECTNPSTGIVRNPKPHPVPPRETPPPTRTPPTSAPPTTTPPTTTPPTTPPTTTPPTTTPPTTTPPTTTPPTTTPPTTTPPTTTPPPTCPPGQTGTPPDCLQPKDPDDDVPGPEDKPTVTAPPDPVETTEPVETSPADPTDQPGGEATDEPADGATQQPTTEPTQPPVTEAPSEEEPGETPTDPDGNAAAGMLAAPLLGLGAWLRRRHLGV